MKGRKRSVFLLSRRIWRRPFAAIRKAAPLADFIELRVDYMRNPELQQLLKGRRKPFIVTNRRREEGGRFQGNEGARVRILEEAVGLGADYVRY